MEFLLIEDDATLAKALTRGLEEAGHGCRWVQNGQQGLETALAGKFSAVVLDLMLPDLDGMVVLGELRKQGVRTPVLVLTAMGSVDDRVSGLEGGADDYLVKPFAFPELVARLNAVTRRAVHTDSTQLMAGPISLDITSRKAVRDGQEIDLTPTEFRLLEFFMRHADNIVTRKMLCEHLWESHWEGVTNVIEVHITRLRGKIDRDFAEPLLHTVRGRGYVLRAS